MRPYISKKINFQTFVDIMIEKTDVLRVYIDSKQFSMITFSMMGLPAIVNKLFAVLTS